MDGGIIDDQIWNNFDSTSVRERFKIKNTYGRYADILDVETKRFLFLCANIDEELSPSFLVDEYWHAMILNTQLYESYCLKSFGKFIHHHSGIPSSKKEVIKKFKKSYLLTIFYYRKHFGEPNLEIWPMPEKWLPENYLKPHRIHIETTNHCNLNCTHCYPASSIKNPHHKLDKIIAVLDEAKRNGVEKITLTGGEVFTRPDWKQIIKKSLTVCSNIYIITNGLLVDHDKLIWLTKQKVLKTLRNWSNFKEIGKPVEIGLAFSLDGLESNGITRQNSAGKPVPYEKIVEKIKLASDYGLHITINTTLTNEQTALELPDLYRMLTNYKIDRWQIDNAYLAGRFKSRDSKSPDWIEKAKPGFKYIVQDYLKNFPNIPEWRLEIVGVFRYDSLFYGFSPAESNFEHPCSYHFGSVIVEKGNEVRFCPSLRTLELGKINPSNFLKDIYENNTDFKEFLSKTIADLPCIECRYSRIFHGGCRANSWAYNGKMWDRDPICCSLSPFVEDEIIPYFPRELQSQFSQSLDGGLRPDRPGHPVYDEAIH